MQTSEVRKAALRLAKEMYERASGQLKYTKFDIAEEAARTGVTDPADARSILDYLTSVNVMKHREIGNEWAVYFTPVGIDLVEASIDEPDKRHGPFPPMNVVVSGSGSQVAIGSGSSFTQTMQTGVGAGELQEIVRLVRGAIGDWSEDERRGVAGARAALEGEAESAAPDRSLVKAAMGKLAKVAETAAGGAATQALLAYLRSGGYLPPMG